MFKRILLKLERWKLKRFGRRLYYHREDYDCGNSMYEDMTGNTSKLHEVCDWIEAINAELIVIAEKEDGDHDIKS